MGSEAAGLQIDSPSAPVVSSRRRNGYFLWASIALLLVVVVGFAPTFFLRPFLDRPPLAASLFVHGVAMTAWFLWLVLQTSLVHSGQTRAHRRLGWVGAAIAGSVVAALNLPLVGAVAFFRGQGLDWESNVGTLPFFAGQDAAMISVVAPLSGNAVTAVVFALMVFAAVLFRGTPEVHKRLLLLATVPLTVPALGRAAAWAGPVVLAMPIALVISLLVYDVRTRRRPHWATLVGVASIVVGFGAARIFAGSDLGEEFVRLVF